MSLNGLDNPKLAEAHEAASAEPGGWFLLKYAARDEVELLGRGNGGVVEARNAVNEYDESSPLFGFLKYRRRNVIIRYLPDGCSRLIQARVAVHFTAICERLNPYDISFEITEPDELKDTKLSAACSLHAASNSNTSSTSSLRKKRLGEIAEEDEDEQRATKRQSLTQEEDEDAATPDGPASPPADPVTLNADLAASPDQTKFSADNTAELPNFVGVGSPAASHQQRPATSSAATITDVSSSARRLSSQTLRPDLFTSSSYTYGKHKVKLGPRPSLEAASARPQVAGNFRPVSTIPAGLKLFGKGSRKGGKARDDAGSIASATSPHEEGPEPAFPAAADARADVPARPTTSSGVSIASTVMSAPMPVPAKGTTSREKARLMKAKQLRDKKKKMSVQAEDPPPTPTPPTEAPPSAEEAKDEDGAAEEKRLSMIQADSGVALEGLVSPAQTDRASELTRTDSRPASPAVASPEPGQSTKASSLSESTDETVQAKDEAAPDAQDEPEGAAVDPDAQGSNEEGGKAAEAKRTEETAQPLGDEAKGEVEESKVDEAADGAVPEPRVEDTPTGADVSPDVVTETSVVQEEAPAADAAKSEEAAPVNPEQDEEGKAAEEVESEQAAAAASEEKKEDKTEVEHETAAPEPFNPTDLHETKPSENVVPEEAPVETPAAEPQEEGAQAVGEELQGPDAAPGSDAPAAVAVSKTPEEASVRPTTPEAAEQAAEPAEATEESSSPRLKIPKSKFSTQDLRAAAKASAAIPSEPLPGADDTAAPEERGIEAAEVTPTAAKSSKRKLVEPIRTDLAVHSRQTSRSDMDNMSVDEELMEELQSATVEEAKPLFVSKTPVTPGFPSDDPASTSPTAPQPPTTPGSGSAQPHMVRTVSNPLRGALITPTDVSQSSARSVSMGAAYLHKVTQQQAPANLTKKSNVGSSISQRIKALEKLSAEPAGAQPKSSRSDSRPSSTFFSVKKGREPSRSPSVVDRAGSLGKKTPPSAVESRESSPEPAQRPRRDRSGSMASRLSMFESPPGGPGHSPGNTPRGRPESISVTAKIVRDPNHSIDAPRNPSEYNHLALKQSPLLVDHQRAAPDAGETVHERRSSRDSHRSGSHDNTKSRRSSMTIVRDFIKERRRSVTSNSGGDALSPGAGPSSSRSPSRPPSTHHNSTSLSHRLSMSSRRSLSRDRDNVLSPSALTESSLSGDEAKSTTSGGDKKKSRAGRFMRRLSSLSGSGSRGKTSGLPGISPTVAEEDAPPPADHHHHHHHARPSTTGAPAIVSYLGDVNVQFPDNLLWKRRNMCLDAGGFVILGALPAQSGRAQQGSKRYHLGEFRAPYAPDVEVQELPNSVVLDLVGGSAVQVACEDRAGQMAVLQILQEAHAAHSAGFGK